MTTDENFLAQYSKDGDLSKYITGLGLKNTSRLILTTAIPYLPTCIYFVQENEEFLLPLEDGRAGIQGLQVYRVSDIVETFLMPILNYQDELAEKYADLDPMDIPLGDPPVPDDLPMQAAVDLNTYFAAGADGAPIRAESQAAPGPYHRVMTMPVKRRIWAGQQRLPQWPRQN